MYFLQIWNQFRSDFFQIISSCQKNFFNCCFYFLHKLIIISDQFLTHSLHYFAVSCDLKKNVPIIHNAIKKFQNWVPTEYRKKSWKFYSHIRPPHNLHLIQHKVYIDCICHQRSVQSLLEGLHLVPGHASTVGGRVHWSLFSLKIVKPTILLY